MVYRSEEGRSKSGKHPLLIYRWESNENFCFKFAWKKTAKKHDLYVCLGCQKVKDRGNDVKVDSIPVDKTNKYFLSNPEELNHCCIQFEYVFQYVAADVQQELRQTNIIVQEQRLKPSIAHANLRNIIQSKYGENSINALSTLPKRKSVLDVFSKKRKKAKMEDFDPLNPPESIYESKLTRDGETSLLLRSYSNVSPPFMYLADRTNLESLHSAQIVMFDGTFAYCPREFYRTDYISNEEHRKTSGQTYTMHAVYSTLPERQSSFLCGISFLPYRSQATYVKLFSEIRQALIDEFGNIGIEKTIMMDFEIAAHNAIEQVFPEWTVKTCFFHFVKNVKDQSEKKVSASTRNDSAFKKWLNEILGAIFLPIDDARIVFEYLLNNLPTVDTSLNSFVQYLRRFWFPKLDKICCWDNNLPRTNNPAEAYHSKLRSAFEHEEHPKISAAFSVHSGHLADSAIEFLNFGGDNANLQKRNKKQRELDKKLVDGKNKLIEFAESTDEAISIEYLLKYCRHVRYLIGSTVGSQTNPDATLTFEPLPVNQVSPVLRRPLLIPNVVTMPIPSTSTVQARLTQTPQQASLVQAPENS